MNRLRVVAVLVAIAVIAIAGRAVFVRGRGTGARRRVVVSAPSGPTTRANRLPSTTRTASSTSSTEVAAASTSAPAASSSTEITAAPTTPPPARGPEMPTRVGPTPGTVGAVGLGTLRGRTIAIDPGHNGANFSHTSEISKSVFIGTQTRACDTTGTETNDGYSEAAYNLDVALRLRDVLVAAGARVVMTRTTNDGWGPCIDARAAIGNSAHADAAISIHADGGPADGRGFHVLMPALVNGYTDDIYASSHRLGVDVRDAFVSTGMPTSTYYAAQGLAERTDLGGLNLSNVPKVFIETGNMRNATDAALLQSADFREREAHALAAGLDRYLGGG